MLCFPNFWLRGSKLTIFFQLSKENGRIINFCNKKSDLFMSSH